MARSLPKNAQEWFSALILVGNATYWRPSRTTEIFNI